MASGGKCIFKADWMENESYEEWLSADSRVCNKSFTIAKCKNASEMQEERNLLITQLKEEESQHKRKREKEHSFRKQIEQLKAKISCLETLNKELQDENYKHESTLRELRKENLSLEDETKRLNETIQSLRQKCDDSHSCLSDSDKMPSAVKTPSKQDIVVPSPIRSSYKSDKSSSDTSLNNQNMNSEDTSNKVDKDAFATKLAGGNLVKTNAQSNAPNDCNPTKTNTEINFQEMKEKTKYAVDERKQLEEKLDRVTKEKQDHEKKLSQLSAKLNELTTELKDEKEVNRYLRWQNRYLRQKRLSIGEKVIKQIRLRETKEKEIVDLQEQVRDLMFRLDAKDQLQGVPAISQEEIQEGQIGIGEAAGSSSETISKPRRKKKNH